MTRAALITLLSTLSPAAHADIVYRPSLEALCIEANLVVEAQIGPGGVVVTTVLHGQGVDAGDPLDIAALATVERAVTWNQPPGQATAIQPTRALLFLAAPQTLYATGSQGSPSIYWSTADDRVYGYVQVMNPGDLRLVAGGPDWGEVPPSRRDLVLRVETALVERRVWQDANAQSPAERARRIAPYTARHSSRPTYRMHTIPQRVLRPALAALGKDAVQPLIQVLQTAPQGADLNLAVLTLYDIGPAAIDAIPALNALKSRPGATHVGYIDTAIAAISGG